VLGGSVLLFVFLRSNGTPWTDGIRYAAFQVVSIITTTGDASGDFRLWSGQAKVVLLALMFIGGSAGSAGAARESYVTC
jgi:Trk-type K+ transport system membrane component